jgi:hypothetical protein
VGAVGAAAAGAAAGELNPPPPPLLRNMSRQSVPLKRSGTLSLEGSRRRMPVMAEQLVEAEVEARTEAMAMPGRRSPAWVIRRISEAKQERLVSEVRAERRGAERRGLSRQRPAARHNQGSQGGDTIRTTLIALVPSGTVLTITVTERRRAAAEVAQRSCARSSTWPSRPGA